MLQTAVTTEATGGLTFKYQDKLSKLPIPELKDTIDRYLASLKPLQVKVCLFVRFL